MTFSVMYIEIDGNIVAPGSQLVNSCGKKNWMEDFPIMIHVSCNEGLS
jgi:hypothetical protein